MKNISDLKKIASQNFQTIEEAKEILSDFSNKQETLRFGDCQIDEDLNIVNGKTIETSFEGLKSISKALQIPFYFSERIPADLFIDNANRLFKENSEKYLNVFVSNKNNYVVDSTIRNSAFNGDLIFDIFKDTDFKIAPHSYITENRINVKSYLDMPELNVEPKPGDLTQFGTNINFNWLIKKNPKIETYSHTLACTNGAIYKTAKFIINQDFRTQLQKFLKYSTNIAHKLTKSSSVMIPYNKFVENYKQIRGIFGNESAERIFISNEDEIKKMSKYIKKLKDEDNFALLNFVWPLTDHNYYDIFYNATHEAHNNRNLNKEKSDFLQRWSGKLIVNEIN